ncbi:MAG: SPFH domain-containing protein [Treponema sp.]|jgi:regulator of protease activity HflC (stomatin/prohibitin superfamily)|nr:SPFH domain-containing protein [Treponema sp.]
MNDVQNSRENTIVEKTAFGVGGMAVLLVNTLLTLAAVGLVIWGARNLNNSAPAIVMIVFGVLYSSLIGPVVYKGLKVLRPREALVLALFGKYYGTLAGPGFFWINPFAQAFNPASTNATTGSVGEAGAASSSEREKKSKTISLKVMTLNNDKQKINDQLGNPIIIGIAVVWRVADTAKAVFNVDNYTEFLSIQCDAALRNIVRLYPYDSAGNEDADNEKSLRGSSEEISKRLSDEIQGKAAVAGLEILEARITHLSYAPEIAAAMLQRQQAAAIIDARQMIVEGAVSMVEMALNKLDDKNIVCLDEERKAAMVSNLLVVLCSNKDTQPVVNSGSIY